MQNRIALVTGGSRGIGRAISIGLAELGIGVAVNFRSNAEEAARTRADCLAAGAPWCQLFQADVADLPNHAAMVDGIVEAAGRIDVLVNNAGIASPSRGDLLDVKPEAWDTVLAANLKGPFFLAQHTAKRMIELRRRGAIAGGHIVNVTSISAGTPSINRGEYCVSKAGLSMASQLFAHRLAPENIQVHEIRPGVIRTDMSAPVAAKYDQLIADGMCAMARWGEARDVALAVSAIVDGKFPFSTGHILNVDGGFCSRAL